jgi:hypothetical protein
MSYTEEKLIAHEVTGKDRVHTHLVSSQPWKQSDARACTSFGKGDDE